MTEILEPREVPLGGLRAMTVRRTLPQRQRSLIGAWCFLDHYGPDRVDETGGMIVAPHPHIGLQTVSWLFGGAIEHRDSVGTHALVRPGELNLMTAGRGISHSEVSTDETTELHGVQLWVALPSALPRRRAGLRPLRTARWCTATGWDVQVFLGSMLGSESPVETFSPLVGAEMILDGGTALTPDTQAGVRVRRAGRLRTRPRQRRRGQAAPARVRRARRGARDRGRRPVAPPRDRRSARSARRS